MPHSSSTFDVVIVGAGPAGLAAGAEAAKRGISHVVLDRGCFADTIFKYQREKFVMAEPGTLPLRAELPLSFKASSREEVIGDFWEGTRAAGTNLWVGPGVEVTSMSGAVGEFIVRLKDGRSLGCQRVVLALGLQGNLRKFGVPGDHLPHVTYQLDDPKMFADQRIVVVGVGDAAIENAIALKDRNYVTVVNRNADIDRAKGANKLALLEASTKKAADGKMELAYLTRMDVKEITPKDIVLVSSDADGGVSTLPADLIIGRLGALPPRKFLEDLGIRFSSGSPEAFPTISDSYESSVPGVYVVGALAGCALIKQCLNQGCEVIEHIAHQPGQPVVVPTDEPVLYARFHEQCASVTELLDRIRRSVPLFSALTNVQLREFLGFEGSEIVSPARGEAIYERGEGGHDFDDQPWGISKQRADEDSRSSDDFYAILDGSVEVIAPALEADADAIYCADSGDESAPNTITLKAGEFFGEGSLIADRRRTATVVAGANCVLLKAPRFAMTKLMKVSPDVKRSIDDVFILRKLQNAFAPKRSGAEAIPIEELRALAHAAIVETFAQGETLWEQDRAWFLPAVAWFEAGEHWLHGGSKVLSHDDPSLKEAQAWFESRRALLAKQRPLLKRRDDVASGQRDPSPDEIGELRRLSEALRKDVDEWLRSGAAWFERARQLADAAARSDQTGASAKVVAWLREGKTWFARSERARGLHLIRRGSVTLSVLKEGREIIYAYLPAGSLIGEGALRSADGLRSAKARANVLTETIRLPAEVIGSFIERHEGLRKDIDRLITRRLDEDLARAADPQSSEVASFVLRSGAGEATDIILIDESLCIRCDNCESACRDTHGGVSRLDREAGPTVASIHIPTSCRHCENPKCMSHCMGSCIHRHPSGEIFIDTARCIGCGNCVADCPYHVIQMAEATRPPSGIFGLLTNLLFGTGNRSEDEHHGSTSHAKKAVKCDLCFDLPVRHAGDGASSSACVSACPTGALRRVNPKTDVFDKLFPK